MFCCAVQHISQFATTPALRSLTICAGKLFFTGQEAGFGDELYMYDGTNAPSRITDIAPGQLSSSINYLAATTHALYFSARGSEIELTFARTKINSQATT